MRISTPTRDEKRPVALAVAFLPVCLALLGTSAVCGADPQSTDVTLMTWNVQFLNKSLTPKTPTRTMLLRAPEMGNLIRNKRPSLVGITEGFVQEAVEKLATAALGDGLSLIASLQPPQTSDVLKPLSGGLALLANESFRVVDQATVAFGDNCYNGPVINPDSWTFDCKANKGVLFTRLKRSSLNLNLFVVHLNASHTKKARKIRRRQLDQLANFIERRAGTGENYPTFVMGDFNIKGDWWCQDGNECDSCGFDENLLDILSNDQLGKPTDTYLAECPNANCSDTGPTSGPKRIDYILFYPRTGDWETRYIPGSFEVDPMKTSPGVNGKDKTPASDHFALQASFRITHRLN